MIKTFPTDLRVAALELIVRKLANCDPLASECSHLYCVLCEGEIPQGHMTNCPWWLAHNFCKVFPEEG